VSESSRNLLSLTGLMVHEQGAKTNIPFLCVVYHQRSSIIPTTQLQVIDTITCVHTLVIAILQTHHFVNNLNSTEAPRHTPCRPTNASLAKPRVHAGHRHRGTKGSWAEETIKIRIPNRNLRKSKSVPREGWQ
jgi:hypothetical protein